MASLKENLQIKIQSATLQLEEAGFSFGAALQTWPYWKKKMFWLLLIALIPSFLVVRYGSEYVFSAQYKQKELVAHPSYNLTSEPLVSKVEVVSQAGSKFGAYVQIENPNLELAANNISYTFTFKNGSGQSVATQTGTTYLLPDEKKYIVVPKIDSSEKIASAELVLGEAKWQKKLDMPQVELKTTDPYLYDEANPLTFYAEGSLINNSPYELTSVKLVYLVYDKNQKIIAVSQRDEFKIPAFGRRAYKQLWPDINADTISAVKVFGYTNLLDPINIRYSDPVK